MTRLEQLFKYLGDSPDDSFILFAIAKEYEGAGNEQEALAYYLRLGSGHPNYVGTYYHLGKLYERIGDEGGAVRAYSEGMMVAKKEGDRHAFSELAGARLVLRDEDEE